MILTAISDYFSLRNFMWSGIPSLIELLYQLSAPRVPRFWKANLSILTQLCGWQISFVQMTKYRNSSEGPDSSSWLNWYPMRLVRNLLRHLVDPRLKTGKQEPRVILEKTDLSLLQMYINDWEPVISHRNWCSLPSISSVKQYFFHHSIFIAEGFL